MLLWPWVLIIFGIAALFLGAEWLVRGASQLAIRLGISPLLVGLTVVSLSTSMPEAVASFFARFKGASGDIAMGNVLGSNIANIGLITGLTAFVRPIPICKTTLNRETPLMLAITLMTAFLMFLGPIGHVSGAFLLCLLGAYLFFQYRVAKGQREARGDGEDLDPVWEEFVFVLLGMSVLVVGGYCLIEGAVSVARHLEISERVIGITIVALGTSCPELATSAMAAWRGHSEIAIGNVIGSNIFNLLFVLGGIGTLMPIDFSASLLYIDMPITLGFSLALWALMFFRHCISRIQGASLTVAYIIYISWLCLI